MSDDVPPAPRKGDTSYVNLKPENDNFLPKGDYKELLELDKISLEEKLKGITYAIQHLELTVMLRGCLKLHSP